MSVSVRALAIVSILATAAAAGAETGAETGAVSLSPGEARIRYLHHCGYLVETENHVLVFDYWEPLDDTDGLGWEQGVVDPGEFAGRSVRVFVSHSHGDHWDPVVLEWRSQVEDIAYFFGWERQGEDVTALPAPRASFSEPGLIVHTVNSHHSGVPEAAFLVQVDSVTIFFGGDYQGKPARGADTHAAEDMAYLREAAALGERPVDLLFLGAWLGDCNKLILEGLDPRVVFPMHSGGKEEKYREFAADCRRAGWECEVPCPERRGQVFAYDAGR